MGYLIAWVGRDPKKGQIIKGRPYIQHPTDYVYKRSAVRFAKKYKDSFRKPIAIIKDLGDGHYMVVEVIG